MHTNTWKQLERDTALILGGKRISRGADFGKKNVDVKIPDFPFFKIDTKRYKRLQVFSLFDTLKKKYCKKPEHEGMLVLRQSGKKYILAVIDIKLLSKMLNIIRQKEAQNELK
ncbi:MAG: hypothetical protein WC283_02015 [Candidatus Paceibacterota bacterium]|jgi:hypothetical protein